MIGQSCRDLGGKPGHSQGNEGRADPQGLATR